VEFPQLEAGPVATSYIPNPGTGSAVRVADDWFLSGTAFTDAIDPSAGTLVIEFVWDGLPPVGGVFSLNDGTANNRLDYRAGQNYGLAQKVGGGNTGVYPGGPVIGNNKLAVSWSAAGVAYSINGGTPATGAGNFAMTAVTRLELGALNNSAFHLNNIVRSARSYKGQYITGAALQALSA
jgi:hypothetical protein